MSDFLNDAYAQDVLTEEEELLDLEPLEGEETEPAAVLQSDPDLPAGKTPEYVSRNSLVIDPAKYAYTKQPKPKTPSGKLKKILIRTGCTVCVLAILYCVAVFSNIPFIAKWRTLYIETAMGTMTHQWLAEAFIPEKVIYRAMREYDKLNESQENLETDWGQTTTKAPATTAATTAATTKAPATTAATTAAPEPVNPWLDETLPVFAMFEELDIESFAKYMERHEDTSLDENGLVMIDESDRDQNGTTIETKQGDEVLAVDEKNGILIVKITGEGYMGRIAIIKDESRVAMGAAKYIGEQGSQMKYIAKQNDAILAINANGFEDPDGKGNGGLPYGYIVADGEVKNAAVGGHYKVVGFDENDRMYIGKYKSSLDLRDAGEFTPALVINGEKVVSGSAGWGIQPRCAIGQAENGDVLMLVIDGRQTHSIGATVEDSADQLLKYGAYQACNLDGGSSAVMYYNGRVISQPSAADKIDGRLLPCGFIVRNLPE